MSPLCEFREVSKISISFLGLVTYVGVKMINITRLESPYPDRCADNWQDARLGTWATALGYVTYSTQICLKLCLQRYTVKHCKCWSSSSPAPRGNETDVTQCNTRRNASQAVCSDMIREMYYNKTIDCNCPPRCR